MSIRDDFNAIERRAAEASGASFILGGLLLLIAP
jgi:hypothetical protein